MNRLLMEMKITPIGEYKIVEMDTNKIDVSKQNARRLDVTKGIEELAQSIKAIGLQQPPIVQKKDDDRYELIVGQRRLHAFKMLRRRKIRVMLKTKPYNDYSAKLASIIENIHRRDMNPKDIGTSCKFILEKNGSKTKSAKILGISITTFNKYLGFHGVPEELKKLVSEKKISIPEAVRLYNLVPNVASAKKFAHMIYTLPKPSRDRYFTTLSDNPNATPQQIKKKADSLKDIISFKIHIPMRYSKSFTKASKNEALDYPALGQKAVVEYLDAHGY